jgi:antirestriction protein ArdC
MTEKSDVYSRVTDKIIADLERGNLTWLQPWQAGHKAGPVSRPLRAGGVPYRGVNVLMLWAAAMEKGYSCPLWLTYKQASELGGQVRKGEKGSLVVYANRITKTATDDKGADVEIEIPFMKGYTVFNAEQIDGLPGHFYASADASNNDNTRLDTVERFLANTGATIKHGGSRAFYSPSLDTVHMPELQTFRDAESYYATRAHETIHWTRHENRLNRDFGRKRFGDAGYAMEELVAEIGAAFLCADLCVTPATRDDHAAYMA